MKNALQLLLASTLAFAAVPLMAQDIAGTWLRSTGKSKLTFTCNGDKCTSKVSWLKDAAAKEECGKGRPILGMFNGSVKKTGDNVWQGQVYNPEDCKWYSAIATVNGNALSLKGGYKIFGAYVGKTANFTRSN
ncbi:MAG: DUF2147 domain-containing protein [Leptospiraceae bacterium]|nr:DUF2147 domain-containing protein [Leptospiraceae bacterium]